MAETIEKRLAELGISLDAPTPPAANYVPYVVAGNLVFVSGQIPIKEGKIAYQGKIGAELTPDDGKQAAHLCAISILAQVNHACQGDLRRVRKCVKLGGFVNATGDFAEHSAIINGASDLMVDVLGDAGRHARFAVGAASLPFNVAVEVDAIFEIS